MLQEQLNFVFGSLGPKRLNVVSVLFSLFNLKSAFCAVFQVY